RCSVVRLRAGEHAHGSTGADRILWHASRGAPPHRRLALPTDASHDSPTIRTQRHANRHGTGFKRQREVTKWRDTCLFASFIKHGAQPISDSRTGRPDSTE